MHGMDDQVDMRRFGGLARYMKITWVTFMAGWLAILGVPPFSGFWSKDKIIEAAFVPVDGAPGAPGCSARVALLGAGITAFYMSRLFFMTFEGERRWSTKRDGSAQHPHESPKLMTVPMIVLAVGSVGARRRSSRSAAGSSTGSSRSPGTRARGAGAAGLGAHRR